ncbi:histidine triad nucleotide-binding protein 3-like isoform X2 [Acanthopagrus latus]|nr:histidine triad nucleotide-binding protein 3-like isoform X2 [Acanthopagrus latus]
MAEFGKAVLRDMNADMNDISLGFHQPPYTSVDHLHLHVLAPSSRISEYLGYKFNPKSSRFVTDKHLLKHLKSKDPPVKGFKRKALKTPMETRDASGSEDCPFCRIAQGQTDAEILLSDDELLCFRDMKPGATHHYLVVTRTHIDNCKSLQEGDIPLVERMVEMGRTVLEKNKVSNLDDVRFGFHIPPFSSVPHLHLHALAPASTMGFKSQLRYGPQSHWFITVDKVLSQLKIRGKVN